MIIFYHNNSIVTDVVSTDVILNLDVNKEHIVSAILKISAEYRNQILVWCDENERDNTNIDAIDQMFHHNKIMVSYNPEKEIYFDSRIGYLEDTLFIKVNKSVRYPTWQMSSKVGAIHSSVINACKSDLCFETNFDYFLNSFAKRAMPLGLLCYSEPKLLKKTNNRPKNSVPSLYKLFRFTKQHYKTRWVFLLFINLIIFEKKIPIIPFISAFFNRKRKLNSHLLDEIEIISCSNKVEKGTIDVLIPTIGRKNYLLSVLENLESQTYKVTNVNQQLNAIFSRRIVDFVSKIGYCSYSIYVIHTFVIYCESFLRIENTFLSFALVFTGSVVAGFVMTYTIEDYFLKIRNKLFPNRVL